jgi:gustatory receptor
MGTVGYLTLSLMEHAWSLLSLIEKIRVEIATCKRTDINPFELFIMRHVGIMFETLQINYNHGIAIVFEFLNFSYTFYWNFLNLFIILTSIGIAFLFERISFRLSNVRGLLVRGYVWAEIRSHHLRVVELLRLVNRHIDELLFVACFNDGYFILSQMMNINT